MKGWVRWFAYQLRVRDYCFPCDRVYWRWRYWPHKHGRRCVVVESEFGYLLGEQEY